MSAELVWTSGSSWVRAWSVCRALGFLLGVCAVSACADSNQELAQEPLSSEVVTLRVENISAFTYEVIYAHVNPSLNLSTARSLTQGPIEPEGSTTIELPVGAYLSAVRPLVERGPRVAIRSEGPLTPAPEHTRLQLLDEGFLLSP